MKKEKKFPPRDGLLSSEGEKPFLIQWKEFLEDPANKVAPSQFPVLELGINIRAIIKEKSETEERRKIVVPWVPPAIF